MAKSDISVHTREVTHSHQILLLHMIYERRICLKTQNELECYGELFSGITPLVVIG